MSAYVYRMWDANDRLLYVGMTTQAPQRRIGRHLIQKWWGDTVTRFAFEEHETKEAALKAESRAIRGEEPRWNMAENAGTFKSRQKWPLNRWHDLFLNMQNSANEWGRRNEVFPNGAWRQMASEFDFFHKAHTDLVFNPTLGRRQFVPLPAVTTEMLMGYAA